VGFEIAQQLVREGERVSFLGLIDTFFHNTPAWVFEATRVSRNVRSVHGFQNLVFRGVRYVVTHFKYRVLDLWIRLGRSVPYKQRRNYYNWFRIRTSYKYVHKSYLGHITMFSSAGNSELHKTSWQPLARGGLTVFEIPAGHDDMIAPPHSKLLAEHFDTCLDAIERNCEPQQFSQGRKKKANTNDLSESPVL
jgi:thioesterase domain-containing protein